MAGFPIRDYKLSDLNNYSEIYSMLKKQRIVTCLSYKNGSFLAVTSQGELIQFYPDDSQSAIRIECPWSAIITTEILAASIYSDFPCAFSLASNTLVYLTCTEGDILTANIRDISVSTHKLHFPVHSITLNQTHRVILALGTNIIQILAFSKKNELLAFSPFTPNCKNFCCDNSVFFSKKFGNLFFYVDKIKDSAVQQIIFGANASHDYMIVKCIIDNREITESNVFALKFETELVSIDIDSNDNLIFLTADNTIHSLLRQSIRLSTRANLRCIRWDPESYFVTVMSDTFSVIVI